MGVAEGVSGCIHGCVLGVAEGGEWGVSRHVGECVGSVWQ